jgi:hypothetical protein
MEIRQLAPQELPGLAQVWEAALGRRFPTVEHLMGSTGEPRLVSAVVAGDEIVPPSLQTLRARTACASRGFGSWRHFWATRSWIDASSVHWS